MWVGAKQGTQDAAAVQNAYAVSVTWKGYWRDGGAATMGPRP